MISDTFLKNHYYSSFLLPKTILICGLFRTFAGEYKTLKDNGKKKEITGGEIPVQVTPPQTGRRTHVPVPRPQRGRRARVLVPATLPPARNLFYSEASERAHTPGCGRNLASENRSPVECKSPNGTCRFRYGDATFGLASNLL